MSENILRIIIIFITLNKVENSQVTGILNKWENSSLKEFVTLEKTELITVVHYVTQYDNIGCFNLLILQSHSDDSRLYFSNILSEVFEYLGVPIIVRTQVINRLNFESLGNCSYLIIIPDIATLRDFLNENKTFKRNSWKRNEKFLIVNVFPSSYNITNYMKVFEIFWEDLQVLDVMIFMTMEHGDEDTKLVLTYNPFLNYSLQEDNIRMLSEEKIQELSRNSLRHTTNLHGHNLKVSVFNDTPTAIVIPGNKPKEYSFIGIDSEIVRTLAECMNFTPIFIVSTATGTLAGAMSDLISRRADMIGNEVFVKYYGTNELTFIVSALYSQEVALLVPKSKKLDTWMAVLKDLNLFHYIFAIIAFLCGAVVFNFLNKFKFNLSDNSYRHHKNASSSIFLMLHLFMNMPVHYLTRITATSQRILLASCLMFSWITVYNFQGLLLDVVSNPQFSANIDNLEMLIESGLKIFASQSNLLDTFNYSRRFQSLSPRLKYDSQMYNLVKNMKRYQNFTFITSKTKAKWIMKIFKGYNSLHMMEESPVTYFTSYMVHRYSPYTLRLRALLGRMIQAGLINKWASDYEYHMDRNGTNDSVNDSYEATSLKISDVVVAFLFLSFALSVCTIIFILEMCMNY